MRKTLAVILCLLLLPLICCDVEKLPEDVDKNTVCELGVAVVDQIRRGDYPLAEEDAAQLKKLGAFENDPLVYAVGTEDGNGWMSTRSLNTAAQSLRLTIRPAAAHRRNNEIKMTQVYIPLGSPGGMYT